MTATVAPVSLLDQTDYLGESVADGLAIQRQGRGQLITLSLKPTIEHRRERIGIDLGQQRIKNVLARGLTHPAAPFLLSA